MRNGCSTPSLFANAANSPQAAAYLAWVKVEEAKDVGAWKKVVPAEASKQLERAAKESGEKPEEMLEMIGMVTPGRNRIADLRIDNSKATLSVVGKLKGGAKTWYGTIEIIL